MKNKNKITDELIKELNDGLPSGGSDDDSINIDEIENNIMEKLEKRIDEKMASYQQPTVEKVDNSIVDSNNDPETDDNGGIEDGDN